MSEKTQGGKKGRMQCVETYNPHDNKSLSLIRPGFDQRDFRFDSVLDMESSQDTSYSHIADPVVNDVLNGFNGVIMAFGQTGSGKTHTIFGSKGDLNQGSEEFSRQLSKNGEEKKSGNPSAENKYQFGIVPRAVHQIFNYIEQNPNQAVFRVTISFLEIYMEHITDLLLSTGTGEKSTTASGN